MRKHSPRVELPPQFTGAAFSVTPALRAGVGEKRLRGTDLAAPFHGTRASGDPESVEEFARAYATRMPGWAAFGGPTAALLLGLPVPWRLRGPLPLEVVVPPDRPTPRRAGIRGRALALTGPPIDVDGLRVCSPADVWSQSARLLKLPELVALGDALIRRDHSLCSRTDLAAAAEVTRVGIDTLRRALPLLSDRSESDPESQVRVLLTLAGILGLEVNHEVVVEGRRVRLDLAIPHLRIGIEYQGDYHRDRDQWRRDLVRRTTLEAAGWTIIELGAADLRDPEGMVRRIRAVIARVEARTSPLI